MRFEKDLFISYAHIDNKPLTPEQQGWITRFHASLEALLSMRMGGKARIWRDDKLQGNDIFDREIVDQFAQTAVLVSVLTPRYLSSEWCNREVAEFCKRAEERGGMVVENKARMFKVLKAPVDTQERCPFIEAAACGNRVMDVKLSESRFEVGAAHARRGVFRRTRPGTPLHDGSATSAPSACAGFRAAHRPPGGRPSPQGQLRWLASKPSRRWPLRLRWNKREQDCCPREREQHLSSPQFFPTL